MPIVFEECHGILDAAVAPDPAKKLLRRMEADGMSFDELWWFQSPRDGQLPERALEAGAAERREAIRTAVTCHVEEHKPSTVVLVCHWGVIKTLAGEDSAVDATNLEIVSLGPLDKFPPSAQPHLHAE